MKFSIRYADKIVGAFIILALVILVFVIFMLGRNQRWFARDYEYVTYVNSASGISANMAVQYKGFSIGRVTQLKLDETDRVQVTFVIFDIYNDRVREGSMIDVQVSPIGLGSQFIFYPGLGTEQIEEGGTIYSVNSSEGKKLIMSGKAKLPDKDDSITNILGQVNTLLTQLNEAIMGSENSTFGRTFLNLEDATRGLTVLTDNIPSDIGDNIKGVLTQLDSIMSELYVVSARLSDPDGAVMAILNSDGPVYHSLTETLGSLSDSMTNLEKITGYIPSQFPQVTVLLTSLHSTLKTAQDVLTALVNNPLLKNGVPVRVETPPGGSSPRDLGF